MDNTNVINSKKHASFAGILMEEGNVQDQTYKSYGKWFERFEQAINVILELCYHNCALPGDQESDEYRFILFVLDTYYEIALSFRSCRLLMEKGLYHDSLNCCRSILENLVKYKYLLDHKEQIIAYETDGKDSKGNKITIRTAFEYVAGKDSRKVVYRLLSMFEHKNFGSSLPRLNALLNLEKTFSLLPEFNTNLAEGVINHLLYLLFGYINLADRFFSFKTPLQEADFYESYIDIKIFFDEQIQKRKIKYPESKEWCEVMEKIIY